MCSSTACGRLTSASGWGRSSRFCSPPRYLFFVEHLRKWWTCCYTACTCRKERRKGVRQVPQRVSTFCPLVRTFRRTPRRTLGCPACQLSIGPRRVGGTDRPERRG